MRRLLLVRDGRVDPVGTETTKGVGVRARHERAVGFAATADVSVRGAEEALARLLALARRSRPPMQMLSSAEPP